MKASTNSNINNKCSATILDVRVDNITLQETLERIELMALSQNTQSVIPINPEMIMLAQKDKGFKKILNQASLVLPDGIGVVIASRILGKPIRNRVTGVDTVKRLAAMAVQKRWKLFLLGAAPGVAEKVKEKLEFENPGIHIVGTYAGSPHPDEDETICNVVTSLNPHILFVAYGVPKQELWVDRNLEKLKVPVVICVGGTFDFIAGISRRAPKWMQNLGLEWLYRLLKEPWRWRRMLALPRFAVTVIFESVFAETSDKLKS